MVKKGLKSILRVALPRFRKIIQTFFKAFGIIENPLNSFINGRTTYVTSA